MPQWTCFIIYLEAETPRVQHYEFWKQNKMQMAKYYKFLPN